MPHGEETGATKGRSKPSREQLEHIRNFHLSIFLDEPRDRVEITYVYNCGQPSCNVPHTTLSLTVCPKPPCG